MKDMSHRVTLFRRVRRDDPEGGDHHFYRLKEQDRLFSKPTVLCCGGRYINAHQRDPETDEPNGERSASGFAKVALGLLGHENRITPQDPIDVVSVVYPEPDEELSSSTNRLSRATFRNKIAYTQTADNFVYDYIEPLLVDGKKQPLGLPAIKKNLRNIHILAHSYGGTFVRYVGNALYTRMRELDFTPEEIREVTAQILVVAAGTTAPLAGGKADFTTIDLLNSNDERSGASYPAEGLQQAMLSELFRKSGRMSKGTRHPANELAVVPMRLSFDQKLRPAPTSRSCLVYAAPPPASGWALDPGMDRSNCRGEFYDEATKGLLPTERDETSHQVETYLHFGAGRNGFMLRLAASSALANGINNALENASRSEDDFAPLAGPMALLKCPKKLLYPVVTEERDIMNKRGEPERITVPLDFTQVAAGIHYDERIKAACRSPGRRKG